MKNKLQLFSLLTLGAFTASACAMQTPSSEDCSSSSSSHKQTSAYDYRVDRDFSGFPSPCDEFSDVSFPSLPSVGGESQPLSDGYRLINGGYALDFVKSESGYILEMGEAPKASGEALAASFINEIPTKIFLQGSGESFSGAYDEVINKDYGCLASKTFTSTAGSVFEIKDAYYLPKEGEEGAFNVTSYVLVTKAASADAGFASEYAFSSNSSEELEWMAPNIVFKTIPSTSVTYRETRMGVPMCMMRNKESGATLSLQRYQPIVTYENNSYASFTLDSSSRSLSVSYPAYEGNRKYHALIENARHVYDLTLRLEKTDNYEEASSSVYNAAFNLQNQRIVNTDIREVYKVIAEDYKTFLHEEEQEDEETGKKYTSYGLPWRITIEDGEFGPYTYQAGFIGQQIPSAYNMMLYGLMNNDYQSLINGIHILDFWVEDAEFMSVAGVPRIWYDTWSDSFRAYPCFMRMAVDAMEGLLDAYRLASSHGIVKDAWWEAISSFNDFLINQQNDDGSYYRCYNYSGGPFANWDDGIEEPEGNICQSESKSSTAMPIRYLGKMYELTGDDSYKIAALKAGEYVYQNFYEDGYYYGGTCDNPNQKDKEAGVYAMYAYDTLYTLTCEEKWLTALKQAASFVMQTVMIFSFPVKASSLKSAYPLYYGYNDGMSFIGCTSTSGVDNYASFIYYELFRIYVMTGEETYLKQAEFIQQNTKSIMNWDGTLGYKYKSLVAEASDISSFTYSSASDGAWVTWSSFANIDPISKMMTGFGSPDVMDFAETDILELRDALSDIGVGGHQHITYENTIVSQL